MIFIILVFGHVSCTNNSNGNFSSQYINCLEAELINSDYLSLDTASLEVHSTGLRPNLNFYKFEDYKGYIVSGNISFTDVLQELKKHGKLINQSVGFCDLKSVSEKETNSPRYYTTISGVLKTVNYAMVSCQISVAKNEIIEYNFIFSDGKLLDRSVSYDYIIPNK